MVTSSFHILTCNIDKLCNDGNLKGGPAKMSFFGFAYILASEHWIFNILVSSPHNRGAIRGEKDKNLKI